ncbi:MAG: hypothetical protein NTX82_04340 [Candidatus Parcubacteria bacterium]|nr:hypothetical protein [Candidatus Parcubacteria bacterium]
MNKNVPFISITDFMTREQVYQMLAIARKYNGKVQPVRKLGVGVMMSYTTLNEIPSPFLTAFPRNHQIAGVFILDPLVFNVLHYADYKDRDFAKSLQLARNWSGYNLHAIQLDMIWPDPMVLADFRHKNPQIQIILQIGTKAFEMIANDPGKLVQKLKTYGQSLDYVLLDKSMGQGKPMDAQALIPFLEILAKDRPDLSLEVGGGLGPATTDLLIPLLEKFPRISWDAEGKLRPSGNLLDPIDWNMAGQYLEKSFSLFSK